MAVGSMTSLPSLTVEGMVGGSMTSLPSLTVERMVVGSVTSPQCLIWGRGIKLAIINAPNSRHHSLVVSKPYKVCHTTADLAPVVLQRADVMMHSFKIDRTAHSGLTVVSDTGKSKGLCQCMCNSCGRRPITGALYMCGCIAMSIMGNISQLESSFHWFLLLLEHVKTISCARDVSVEIDMSIPITYFLC